MKKLLIYLLLLIPLIQLYAQSKKNITITVYDAISKEPLRNATLTDENAVSVIADANGKLNIHTGSHILYISFSGYETVKINTGEQTEFSIGLKPSSKDLQQVVVTASRISEKRTEAPVAIATISKQTMEDTKANRLDQLVNKVSGVFMVNLGNEQHEMSIRQPMTTRSLFLYLEDGIPIRTTGIFNHNALLEMNAAAAKSIEIIKGPASSLYGAEAIGGALNVITQAPPAIPAGSLSLQANNNGYKRVDAQAGNTFGKLGLMVSGYYANRNDGPEEQTDFHKTAVTLRGDYLINSNTTLSTTLTYVDYFSQMGGGSLDSAHFAQKNYHTLYTFNYRKETALRVKSQLSHQWNPNSESQFTIAYRDNSVKQNPSYYVTNNFSNPLLANGQVNNSSFNSYMLIAQHVQTLRFLNSKVIIGASTDISPSTYVANYIRIQRDATGKYISFTNTDSALSNYSTAINNFASYINYSARLARGLQVVAAMRYDLYHYNFQNSLPPSASSGAPSTISNFSKFTPKLGLTYNYKNIGVYGNVSEGYVPPQVTELFNSVKVPYLQPQTFFNYEIGGWFSFLHNTLYADWSLYLLNGTNEIITVQLSDGSYQYQNAGKTRHTGIEYGITYKPTAEWLFRVSATDAKHTFIEDMESGHNYNGNEMANAPHFISNAEFTYKPLWIKGFRIGVEWQHMGSYYMDNANSAKYNGFDVFNIRAGYHINQFEVWASALNALNSYYAVIATKSVYGYTYSMGDPHEFTLGVSYRFGKQ